MGNRDPSASKYEAERSRNASTSHARRHCLRCNKPLIHAHTGRDRKTCSKACRDAVGRRRRVLRWQIRWVLMALEGLTPEEPPPFWPLIVELVRSERNRLRAERARQRLPNPERSQ
ncbi:MAG: hypothetical protein AAFV53_38940 [Myxococcota bacterium]